MITEADLAARRMHETLGRTSAQKAVLSRFVDGLSRQDLSRLRELLDDGPR